MKRIIENRKSLEAVRAKCIRKDIDFSKEELKHLNIVFIELQKSYGKKSVKPLDMSCSHCIGRFMNSVHNYIMFEESKEKGVTQKTEPLVKVTNKYNFEQEITVRDKTEDTSTCDNELLSLPELRTKYPEVKARSKEKFLELLNEQR